MLKAKDLRDQTAEELEAKVEEIEIELFSLRSKLKAERKLEKPHTIKVLRRDRARIMTILTEKELKSNG